MGLRDGTAYALVPGVTKTLKTYEVTVGSVCDDLEVTYRIKATYPKAAEFDAKHQAAKDYPFVDPCDLVIFSIREAK